MAERVTLTERVDALDFPDRAHLATGALRERLYRTLNSGALKEYWKYTPIDGFVEELAGASALAGADTPAGAAPVRPRFQGLDQPGITLTSLAEDDLPYALGAGDDASSGRFPLADLALLLTGDLLVVEVLESPASPVRLLVGDGLAVPVLFLLGPGVRMTLIEESSAERFANSSLYLRLAERSELVHASGAFAAKASHWALTQVQQEAASRYQRQQYACGGSRRRIETQVLLSGAEATADVVGASVVEEGQHLDQQLVVEHRAPGTTSRQRFHGIAAGKGSTVFNGRIHIHPASPGSDAVLNNRNLALHPDAVINTKPELEIYTDDVKCAHGATIGQISEESLFYLRSRGLDTGEARRMLCRAFIGECLDGPLAEAAGHALLGSWSGTAEA